MDKQTLVYKNKIIFSTKMKWAMKTKQHVLEVYQNYQVKETKLKTKTTWHSRKGNTVESGLRKMIEWAQCPETLNRQSREVYKSENDRCTSLYSSPKSRMSRSNSTPKTNAGLEFIWILIFDHYFRCST